MFLGYIRISPSLSVGLRRVCGDRYSSSPRLGICWKLGGALHACLPRFSH